MEKMRQYIQPKVEVVRIEGGSSLLSDLIGTSGSNTTDDDGNREPVTGPTEEAGGDYGWGDNI